MQRTFAFALAAIAALALILATDVDAKRLGGGRSVGKQSSNVTQREAAPAGTPAAVLKKLQEESLKALKSSAVTERFANDDAVSGGMSSAEYGAFVAKEQTIWRGIVKRAGIKAD